MFGQPKEVKPLVRPPMSGAEAMLKSMGLGEIIEAAKAFVALATAEGKTWPAKAVQVAREGG